MLLFPFSTPPSSSRAPSSDSGARADGGGMPYSRRLSPMSTAGRLSAGLDDDDTMAAAFTTPGVRGDARVARATG
ncbi:uncharacterized protein VTP21DRAFT_2426 [Calcarisporiella thermophila]|uniref:uncharacterized protein n=1 Tax=Calcarisporiella thermophila TaxID=911321 RepID=UPI0037423D31